MINNQDETKHRKQMNDLDRKYENHPARQGTNAGKTFFDRGERVAETTRTGRGEFEYGRFPREGGRPKPGKK